MDPRRLAVRTATVLPVSILVACTEQDAEGAAEGFFEWMMLMIIIALVAFVVWALILAGGVAALIAGWRRLNRGSSQSSETPPSPVTLGQTPVAPPPTPPALPGAEPERTGEPAPQLPPVPRPGSRSATDPVAILLIVFGAILVMSAAPIVLFGGDGNRGRGWFDISVPLPMLIVAGVLVWFGVSRSKKR